MWWTLGAAEEEGEDSDSESISLPPNRGGRDDHGRGYGSGRGRGRSPHSGRGRGASAGRSGSHSRPRRPPQLSDIPPQAEDSGASSSREEKESIFTSLGRTVNQYLGMEDDDDNTTKITTESAGYKNVDVKASNNASEAERRANEMSDAMAWMNTPDVADADAVEKSANTGGGNWWENEGEPSSVGIGDEISVVSNVTEFKAGGNSPDLMTMLKQKQDESAKERKRQEKSENEKRESSKLQASTSNARQRAQKMGEAVAWWKDTYEIDNANASFDVLMDPLEEMKHVTDWWGANKDYIPITDKSFNETKKKAMKVRKVLGHVVPAELGAEKKARELKEAIDWWQTQKTTYIEEVKDFEYNQSTFQKINALFGQWELKDLPKQKWEKFDPRDDFEEAERRARDLQDCLGLILNGFFDLNDPHFNSAAINHVKDLFVDWKFRQDNSASDMEEALRWWRLNANSFDPLCATDEDDAMFRRTKELLALFGLREGDNLNSRNKEMKEALKLWAKHKDTPVDELDPYVVESMKKVKHALLKSHRGSLEADEMIRLAQEINDIVSWYQSDGNQIQDLDAVSSVDVEKFKKVQGLLALWGIKVNPSPQQLKEVADSLIYFRRNHYKPEIFDKFEGDKGDKFKKLEQAILDWRATAAESTEIYSSGEVENISKEIEGGLDWLRTKFHEDDVPEFSLPEDVYYAEKVKFLMDKWDPRDAESIVTWARTKRISKEIQDAIDLWRDHGKVFDLELLNIQSSEREVLLKLRKTMLEWRRLNVSKVSEVEAEHTVKEMISAMNWWKNHGKEYDGTEESLNMVPSMMRHKIVTDTLSDWHCDQGMPKKEFGHLSPMEAEQAAKDLQANMGWWDREGKDLNVEQDIEDAEEFEKAKRLAQLWQKTNMPRKHKDQAVKEVTELFNWMRKKSKSFDLDAVKNKKVKGIRNIFNVWGGKKNPNAKVVAREIEEALDWWRRNGYELDQDASPSEEEKMQRLEALAHRWRELAHPDTIPGADSNLDWFRKQRIDEISETLNLYENGNEKSNPAPQYAGAISEEQKRANEMASALDWLQSNDAELDMDDDISVALSVATFQKIDSLMRKTDNSGGITSMESALDWLRSKTDVDDETVNSFKLIGDAMARSGVTDTIEDSGFGGALDWLRKRRAMKEVNPANESSPSHKKVDTLVGKPMTEEEKRAAEMATQLDWLRSNDATDDIEDDMSLGVGSLGTFKNIDARSTASGGDALPSALDWLRKQEKKHAPRIEDDDDDNSLPFAGNKTKKNKEQKKAEVMSKSLDWMREGTTDFKDVEDEFESVGTGSFSPYNADNSDKKGIDEALNWLRQKHPESLRGIDSDTKFSMSAGVGTQPSTKERQKAHQMSKALNWLRSNGVDFEDDSPDLNDYVNRYGSIDTDRTSDTKTAEEMARALDWLRDKDPNNLDDLADPFSAPGSGRNTKEEELAEVMTKALGLLRSKKDISNNDELELDFEQFDVGDFASKSDEERERERQDALNWLRKSDTNVDGDENSSKKFQKLDLLIPKKEGQSFEVRATEMEDALNWLRSKGLDLNDDASDVESLDKLGVVQMGLRSMYEKDRDLKNALSCICNPGVNSESNNAFSKLDTLFSTREGQTDKDRATDLVNALAWLRTNGVTFYDDDGGMPSFKTVEAEPVVQKSPDDRRKDVEEALNWLRQGKAKDSDNSSAFEKIETFLPPTKAGVSDSSRAQEIANALNWLRANGVNIDNFDNQFIPQVSEVGSTSNIRRSTGSPSSKDAREILNWLSNGTKDSSLDPSGMFQKLQSSLPAKKGQSIEDRAQEIANALNWMRQRGFTSENEDDEKFSKASAVVSVLKRSPEQRSKDLSDALNWLCNKNSSENSYDPTGDFSKLDSILPRKRDQSFQDRAECIEECLDWIRGQGSVQDGNDDELPDFDTFSPTGISVSSPEQRLEDLDNVINWIRNGKVRSKRYDPSGDFRKLDKLLPKKRGQTAEQRGRAIEGALDFLRSNNVSPDDDDIIDKYSDVGSIPVSPRTPEQRYKDFYDVLNWIRHQGENDAINDPNGYFQKLDSILPKRRGLKVKDRARQIEKFLDWVTGS